ncbi:MAG: hypothetical protein U1E23_13525 [Reyranellaceae bacterium]
MPLRIEERQEEGAATWIEEWSFAPRSHFVQTKEYRLFLRELGRYVRGEVPGLSMLVAGHRGTGKTTLVRRAVDELGREIIRSSVEQAHRVAQNEVASRRLGQQRPLVVKLYGPGMLETPPPASSGADGVQPTDQATMALQQITIALYRALAGEFATCFANHARDIVRKKQRQLIGQARADELLEIAAQFTLELDNIPSASVLRDLYRLMGRLDSGVLWPRVVGTSLLEGDFKDQGAREIVALTTAAQAFKVCVGKFDAKETSSRSSQKDDSAEAKGETSLKDLSGKILGLVAGVGAGVAGGLSSGSPLAGLAIGAITAVLGTWTFSWSSKRAVKNGQTVDYTFIRDLSKQSLERDLPQVIERVRAAGLAPVFVIDELDKVADPETTIGELINRLKHLTTDFGCFCFLADRAYFEYVCRKVQGEAFPPEHTFFTHRLLLLPSPEEFLDYLRDITVPQVKGMPVDQTARAIFGLFVLHRAKLNLTDVFRQLAEMCGADGTIEPSEEGLRDPAYILAATIQLAIGVVLSDDDMRRRIEDEPRFVQWATDAMYMLSRAWEEQETTVTLDRDAIKACIRARGSRPTETAAAVAIGRIDLDIIERGVARLAELLCNPGSLKDALRKTNDATLVDLIQPYSLIRPAEGTARTFEFLYDDYGRSVEVRKQAEAKRQGLDPHVRGQLEDYLAFEEAMSRLSLDLATLVALEILPPTIKAADLAAARPRLVEAMTQDQADERLAADLPLVEPVVTFVRQAAPRLALLLRLGLQVAADVHGGQAAPSETRRALEAIARYVDLDDFCSAGEQSVSALAGLIDPSTDPPVGGPADWAGDVERWMEAVRRRPAVCDAAYRIAAWEPWIERLARFLASTEPALVHPPSYSDIVCCAAGADPGTFFRRDLRQMSLHGWSKMCLSGFNAEGKPHWSFAAGLAILGFGSRVVQAVGGLVDSPSQAVVQSFTSLAAPNTAMPASLLVMRPAGSLGLQPMGRRPDTPLLALSPEEVTAYIAATQWLRSAGALAAVLDEA